MRTRKSPRNQDRLFRALFVPAATPQRQAPMIRTDDEIDALMISKSSRALMKRDAARARAKLATADGYKIVRMYSDDRGSVTVRRGLTLEQAQQHCRNDQTRGILPDGVRWFDGYDLDKRTR